jgi:hypothetical protein
VPAAENSGVENSNGASILTLGARKPFSHHVPARKAPSWTKPVDTHWERLRRWTKRSDQLVYRGRYWFRTSDLCRVKAPGAIV